MKKILAVCLAVVLSASMASCGKKKNGVDMNKVEGQTMESAEGEKAPETQGSIAGMELTIKDAKLIDYESRKVAVISIDVKNTNASPKAYSDLLEEEVTQEGSSLRSVLVTDVEGVNLMSKMDKLDTGAKATVQVAYEIDDETKPVDVMIYKYAEPDGDKVVKSFNLN